LRVENRLLEIGFGAGTILDAALDQGWDVFGLEVSIPAVEQARKAGFKVFQGPLREANYPSDYFDVVIASEILEHLESPREELKEIFRILRPSGVFWGTTPSCQGLASRLLGTAWSVLAPPDHTQLYSRKGLKLMLHHAGFASVQLKTHGINPLDIINYYRSGSVEISGFDRVEAGYALNESMTKNPTRKAIKRAINELLNVSRLGDSFKIYATKP
jgi:SAM-dependent methyltransferase